MEPIHAAKYNPPSRSTVATTISNPINTSALLDIASVGSTTNAFLRIVIDIAPIPIPSARAAIINGSGEGVLDAIESSLLIVGIMDYLRHAGL
jgi:hypothetical protein